MLGSFKLNFILLYMICGFVTAYAGVYAFKRDYVGRIWGALLIGGIGSFLGALLSSVFLKSSMSLFNVAFALASSALFLFLYDRASRYYHDYY